MNTYAQKHGLVEVGKRGSRLHSKHIGFGRKNKTSK